MLNHHEFAVTVQHQKTKHYIWVLPFYQHEADHIRLLVDCEKPLLLSVDPSTERIVVREPHPDVSSDLQKLIVKAVQDKLFNQNLRSADNLAGQSLENSDVKN